MSTLATGPNIETSQRWRAPTRLCRVLLWALLVSCDAEAPPADAPAPTASLGARAPNPRASSSGVPAPPLLHSAVGATPRPPSYREALPERERHAPAPAKHYASLTAAACNAELRRRKLPVQPVQRGRSKTPHLSAPQRVTGPLRGVKFELPRSVYGLMDCRLVLLLDDMAKELNEHGVVGVVVNNAYRPNSTLPPKPAKRRTSGKRAARNPKQLSQHALGLGIDVMAFHLADGRVLNVEEDWQGKMGEAPCGPKSRVLDEHSEGVELRNITCAIAGAGYCNHLITPNRDKAHSNHLHCDIEAGAHEVSVE